MKQPLTPHDCNLQDYPAMLLDVARLRDSGLATEESPESFRAAVLLWAASWHQIPAASIPDSDAWMAKQCGYALLGKIDRKWAKVKPGALRSWLTCSDGRLYHPVVAEKALECWLGKLGNQLSSGAGNAKRWNTVFDSAPIEAQIQIARAMLLALAPQSKALTKRKASAHAAESDKTTTGTADGIPTGLPTGSQEKVIEGKESGSVPTGTAGAGAPPAVDKSQDPEAKRQLWRESGEWLVANGCSAGDAKAFINALARDYPAVVAEALREAIKTAAPADAKAFAVGIAQRLAGQRQPPVTVPSDDAERTQREVLQAQAAKAGTLPPPEVRARMAGLGANVKTATAAEGADA